jgi:glucokinase
MILAADVGGTWMRAAVVDDRGRLAGRVQVANPRSGSWTQVRDLLRACLVPDVHRAVIAVNGMVDYRDGRLVGSSLLAPEWWPYMTEQTLSQELQLSVAIANDADLAAVGEAWFGAAAGTSDVAYVTLSTGVGAAAVVGGRLVHGRRSLAELGETIIDLSQLESGNGTVEARASGTALQRRARELGISETTAPELERRWRAGDPVASGAWRLTLNAAGVAAANLAWIFAPDVVVVGGGLGLVGQPVIEVLQAHVSQFGPPASARVVPAAFGADAALVGTAAWDRAFEPARAGRTTG